MIATDFKTSIYFHIPFCFKKCSYCIFYSIPKQDTISIERYLKFLEAEIRIKKKFWRFPTQIESVYIGGGTPSYLSVSLLEKLFKIIYNHFDISYQNEFTMEVNPTFCTKEKIRLIKDYGVNRLSFGIQTVDPSILKIIGRIFKRDYSEEIISCAKKAKFNIINLDFMFRLPSQNLQTLKKDIQFIKKVNPDSVYWYETRYETKYMRKFYTSDFNFNLFDSFVELNLKLLGYKRLMTEFYAKNNQPCRYTYDFLLNNYIVGFGPFSITILKSKYYKNVSDLERYYNYLKFGKIPTIKKFILSPEEESIVCLAYKLRFGSVDIDEINRGFHVKTEELLKDEIHYLLDKNCLLWEREKANRLILTHKGLMYTPDVQRIILRRYSNVLRNINFVLGRGYVLR